jgi:hypothetical protein
MGVIDLDTAGSANFKTEKTTHTLAAPKNGLVYLYRDMPNVVDVSRSQGSDRREPRSRRT